MVTMALIVGLVTFAIPCWGMIARSRSKQAAIGMVMNSLEQARQAALIRKSDVWVIFHHPGGLKPDAFRIIAKQNKEITPLDAWHFLPERISFTDATDSLMKERPPTDILLASMNGQTLPTGTLFGGVMFQRSGRVGVPLPGGNSLELNFDSTGTALSESITLSRATGRATSQ
jgi:hypothetical protein